MGASPKGLGASCIACVKVASNTYQEIYLENSTDGWVQRIDIVKEQPKHFGELEIIDGVRVDSLVDIATNKITALLGRIEPKDYIDFYVIMKRSGLKFDGLFELAKQKDLGLFEFYFANSISEVDKIQSWPPLKVTIEIKDVVKFYHDLAEKLYAKIKPE